MKDELCVKGFSAVTEKEMTDVDGGIWEWVAVGVCFTVGALIGAYLTRNA